tara:strand:- start:496 stop:744 length:249 start_codon:yes stop_codon:yes gene_type:complete
MVGTQERRTLNPTIRKNKHLDLNSLFMIKPPNPNVLSGGLIGLIIMNKLGIKGTIKPVNQPVPMLPYLQLDVMMKLIQLFTR